MGPVLDVLDAGVSAVRGVLQSLGDSGRGADFEVAGESEQERYVDGRDLSVCRCRGSADGLG